MIISTQVYPKRMPDYIERIVLLAQPSKFQMKGVASAVFDDIQLEYSTQNYTFLLYCNSYYFRYSTYSHQMYVHVTFDGKRNVALKYMSNLLRPES